KMKHEDDYYTGVEYFVLGFAYNTELVSEEEAPETWDDLVDPTWEGEIQFPNPAASGTSTLMVLSYMMQNGEDEGWEYCQKLSDEANSIPDSGCGPTKGAAMGEAKIAIGFDYRAYEHQANGEDIDFVVPENTPVLVNPMTLIKDGPNPEGGKKFMDRSEEHTSELQSRFDLVCRLLLEKKKTTRTHGRNRRNGGRR